jgi:hypothetical protein
MKKQIIRKLLTNFLLFLSVSVFGQDCAFNSINIEVSGVESTIEWDISQDPGWGVFVRWELAP